ncbi:MAG: ABC transporter ATP-binding protein [Candidatus Sericytochromatia bacterium]
MSEYLIELKNIVKRFGKVVANNNINLAVKKGEVHAIVGENGAGKSTLMKILYGLYQPDEGQIFLNGKEVLKNSPKNAVKAGIGMVHQHFMLIPPMTVAENVILGMETTKGAFVDIDEAVKRIKKLSDDFNLNIDPTKKIEDLSVGENQRVEIIKVLYRGAEILILDEPTAVLTPKEVEDFFKVIKNLVSQGKTVIIITHKLDEIMKISDRLTVIKHGETIRTVNTSDTNPQKIAEMMVGREVLLRVEKEEVKVGDVVLKVENLSVEKNADILALNNVSLEIRQGEILGIAGVEGNGQTELIEAIMGLNTEKIKSGKVYLAGEDVSALTTKQRLDKGFSHVPEDRHKRGLVLDYSIRDNMILGQQHDFTANGFLENDKIDAHAEKMIKEFDIRPPHKEVLSGGMSGGNQQKIIIAREFFRKFKFLISAQPTRGVDIGAIEFIHKQIIKARGENKAILLVSAELSEILSLSDKVAVLYKGKIVKILEASKTNENELGMLMTGASHG